MQFNNNLRITFISKLNSMGFLKKYDFANMKYNISKIEDIDNLFKFLIFKELENNEIKTLTEIMTYYFTRQYSFHNSMYFCNNFFKNFLNYIPSVDICKEVIEKSDVIYKYVLHNEKGFYITKVYEKFCDNLLTAFQIVQFNHLPNIPSELRYLYENISQSQLLTNELEKEYIKKYKDTKDIRYRNALLEHYQRLAFKRILSYHEKYHLSYESLIDLSNKVLFSTIESYSLDSKVSLSNCIRNRFIHYALKMSNNRERTNNLVNISEGDNISNELNNREKIDNWQNISKLILNTSFNDKEMYLLLYGYGLFNFPKKKFIEIADILGVSHQYVTKDLKKGILNKIRKALILESLKLNNRELTSEEKKIVKSRILSYNDMQTNCFRLFFKKELQDKEENLIDLEMVLTEYLREDKKANYILRKRYGRDKYEDNRMVAFFILAYNDTFNPLTIEEYAYLYEVIVPNLKERLIQKQKRVLDLVIHSC